MRKFFWVTFFTLPFVTGCPSIVSLFQAKTEALDLQLKSHCSQHPINWYLQEKNAFGMLNYKFGPKDEKFRKEIENILSRYVETGEDISEAKKIKLIQKYTPNYLKNCLAFYSPSLKECAGFAKDDPKFGECFDAYDATYKNLLEVYSAKALIGGSFDVESFDLGKARKLVRKLEVDPMSVLKP